MIGLSMYPDRDAADAMREAGACAYLTRNGSVEELIAAVREAAKGLNRSAP